ncbi:unnamed protein product, partial [Brenthis ino]
MYRFTNHLTNPNLVLVRKQIGDGSCAALIVMRAPRRRYAKFEQENSPPNKEKPKSRKLFWGTVGATVLTGAAVVYAKSSPEARNWLESNAPWANDFVALVYQENTSYWKFTLNQFNKATTSISNFMFGKEGVSPLEFPQRSEQNLEKDAKKFFDKKTYELPPPTFEPLYVEEKKLETPEVETPAILVQTEKCDPESPAPIRITKDMVELEHDMHVNTKIAIDNYKKATQHCADYNKALYKIIESPIDDLDKKHFSSLQGANLERDSTIKKAQEAASKAKLAIETLDRMIKAGVQAPPESVAATNRYIKQFRADLSEAETAYKECLEKAVLSDKYWNKVEAARMAYKEELQMLFPGIDLNARQLDVRGDTDILLMYTLKQIQYLQNEIAELQTLRELKINRAIECHDEKAIIEAKVEDTLKRERQEKEREFQLKSLRIQAEANRKLKDQLKKQFEIQQEVMQEKLARKEMEVLGKFSRSVSEQVEQERVAFKKELAAMAGKLKAIEQTLKSRTKAEAEARRSQSLWAAAEALHAATRCESSEAKLEKEIKALEIAGKDDKLVQTVLNGIPQEVREKGILTEKTLRERFDRLEKTAVKVALIGRDGASLPVYFLSWLQSKLLFQKFAEIPKDELDNQPTDFTALDTFDIIQRARYHMDHGNLASALRYINLLQGAPRAAAKAWSDAARRHLEIKQAAEAVMAHASQRHQPIDRYVASLHQYSPSQYKVQVREKCPQKPTPPPPKPKDDSAFWGAMAVLFLAGGFVVIAKRSPEIRDWLTIHAPWFDDIIAIAYEENLTYGEFAKKRVNDIKNYFNTLKKAGEPTSCSLDIEPKPILSTSTECEVCQKGEAIEPEPPCEETPSNVVSKTVCEIVERLKDRGEEALSNYCTVITACTLYNQIVTDTMHHFSISTLKELHGHMAERLKLISEHIPQAEEATAAIESLTRYLECGVTGPKEDIESAKQLMSDYLQKIKAFVIQYQVENAKSVALDSQWQKVESLVNKYYKENETMFPELKYEENKLQVSGDMDLVLYHTSRYVG